jgi:protein ImuA
MFGYLNPSRREARETVTELRRRLGLFSFQRDLTPDETETVRRDDSSPELGIAAGGVIEWLVEKPGAGAVTSAIQIMSQAHASRGFWAVIDPVGECYFPAFSGWGLDQGRTLVVRPVTLGETCWAIEQCLRCPGVSATWAWVEERISPRIHRRWQMAAEVGGGVGLFFRPAWARREPVWADLRLLVTPRAGSQGETRRLDVEVLYRRGGVGGVAQVWEIDHAAGHVRLVPQVADSTTAKRAARA